MDTHCLFISDEIGQMNFNDVSKWRPDTRTVEQYLAGWVFAA